MDIIRAGILKLNEYDFVTILRDIFIGKAMIVNSGFKLITMHRKDPDWQMLEFRRYEIAVEADGLPELKRGTFPPNCHLEKVSDTNCYKIVVD